MAVALAQALGRPFVRLGAEPLGHVGLHQLLDRPGERGPEHIGLGRGRRLFETGEQCHPLIGHRGVSQANVRHSLEDHAVTLAVKGLDLHHVPGHYFRIAP